MPQNKVRNYNGPVLPSDVIGTGVFPLSEVHDAPNEEVLELFAVPSAVSRFMDSKLGYNHHQSSTAHDELHHLHDHDKAAVRAGHVRVTLRLEPMSAAEHDWERNRLRAL